MRGTDGFDAVRDSGELRAISDSDEFDSIHDIHDSGGFGAARDSGGFGAARDSGEFRAVRDSGGFSAGRDSGEFRSVRDSGGFGAVPGAHVPQRPAPPHLRFTPTVSTSGPMAPVAPPPEFADLAPPAGRRHRGPLGQPAWGRQASGRQAPGRFPRGQQPPGRQPPGRQPAGRTRQDWPVPRRQPGPPRAAGPRTGTGQDEPASLAAAILQTMRGRNWVTGLAVPILAAIMVGVAVVVIAGANSGVGTAPPSSLAAGFPPARPAAADFTGTAALAGRGISTPLGQVAAFGGDLVAVGSQTGGEVARAGFYSSADNGRTWQLGTVQAAGGVVPAAGQGAALVAGGPHGWVAVGPTAVWLSPNGRAWLLEPALPQLPGDKITALTSTGSGFLAAGSNVPAGGAAKASPVVWLSANGTTWRRLGGTQLTLAAGAGRVTGISGAAANGGVILLSGTEAGAAPGSGMWRSADGGTTWTPVTLPGAGAAVSGVAPLSAGFVAVRPAQVGGFARAAVYTSPDGATWHQSAVLATADNAPLAVGLVSGGPGGAVVTGQADGFDIAFLSRNGVTWTGTDPIGGAAAELVTGVALTAAGQALVAGTGTGAAAGQPLLTLIGAQGGPLHIAISAITGAVQAEVAVNAVGASAATQVAAGSADGYPALWLSTDGGSTWQRATGTTTAVLTRPGLEQLTGVAHGAAGWLAVGGGVAGAAAHPVVVDSADGGTWSAADGAAAYAGRGLVTAAVAAGPGGYVIVGHETAGGHTIAAAWFAPGLTGWQRATDAQPGALDGPGDRRMDAVAATSSGFAAVGAAGAHPAAWLSAAGRTWSLVMLPLPSTAVRAELRYVASDGNTVAAAGAAVTAAGRQLPFAAVSADGGRTWTETALPVPAAGATGTTTVTALAAAGGGFTATGTYGAPGSRHVVVWTLTRGAAPGTTWTAATPAGLGLAGPGSQAITALTASGSTLTGIGYMATLDSEQPTLWQSPVRS